jgi:hypothetical protein
VSTLIHLLLGIAAVYAGAGFVFAIPFLTQGAARLDHSAHGATWGFRLIVAPGVIALWPWLAWRWVRGTTSAERNAHRDRARQPEVVS